MAEATGEIHTLFISGLPEDILERELYNLFRLQFPGYVGCKLQSLNFGQKSAAFVVLESQESCTRAIEMLNFTSFDPSNPSVVMRLDLAKSNTRLSDPSCNPPKRSRPMPDNAGEGVAKVFRGAGDGTMVQQGYDVYGGGGMGAYGSPSMPQVNPGMMDPGLAAYSPFGLAGPGGGQPQLFQNVQAAGPGVGQPQLFQQQPLFGPPGGMPSGNMGYNMGGVNGGGELVGGGGLPPPPAPSLFIPIAGNEMQHGSLPVTGGGGGGGTEGGGKALAPPLPCKTLFVVNFPEGCDENELEDVLSNVQGYNKTRFNKTRTQAWIDFHTTELATQAMPHIQNLMLRTGINPDPRGLYAQYARKSMGS